MGGLHAAMRAAAYYQLPPVTSHPEPISTFALLRRGGAGEEEEEEGEEGEGEGGGGEEGEERKPARS